MPCSFSLNGSFNAADGFFQAVHGIGEVIASGVCQFVTLTALQVLRHIVAIFFFLTLEVFKTAFQLLQLVDDALQVLSADLIHGESSSLRCTFYKVSSVFLNP